MAATAPGALPSPVQDATASSAAAGGARPAGADDDGAESWAERQLAQAAELVDMVAWRHDLRRARVHVNAGASAILGLPSDDACIPIDAFRARIHPDDRAASRASFEQALAGSAQVEMELRFRDAAGRWRPFLTRRRLLRDAAGAPLAMIGVGIDLSARIESMHRQNQLMREFELTARAAGIGYWSAVGSSQVPRWSEQMYRLHGLPPRGPALSIGAWLERFVHAADRCEVLERIRAWLRAGDPFLEMEFRIVRTDGAVRRVLSHSRGERGADGRADIYGVLQDVTEQRAAQAALREAGERAALAARGAGIGTWEQDLATGRVHWDEQMWRLRGLQPQPEPPPLAERLAIVHPDDRAPMLAEAARAADEGRPSTAEFRVQWPDGSWHWLAARAALVHDDTGRALRRFGVNWDVTEARSAQRAREQGEAALRASEAKSRFLSRMSHELRTPLNAVLGFTRLLLDGGERIGADTRRRHLEQVEIAGQHLLTLIDDVLDLSSVEAGVRIAVQPAALAPLVEQTLPLVAVLAQRHDVRVSSGTLDYRVQADPLRLRQVLLNLLSNAVKYNRPGGQVRIDAQACGAQVVIAVSDTGRGMDPAELQQAFEPFNRLGRETEGIEGTGIGLSIVRSLVERMGGTLQASSSPGSGSRFELWLAAADAPGQLPCARPPAGAQARPWVPPEPVSRRLRRSRAGPPRLLYIEDNPVNVVLVQELAARRSGLDFASAPDGEAGLRQAMLAPPDLILLDMQLPDGDGHAVLRRLRAEPLTTSIPCIALSANALPEDIERALRAGFDDYWTKPLDFDRFDRLLDLLLNATPGV